MLLVATAPRLLTLPLHPLARLLPLVLLFLGLARQQLGLPQCLLASPALPVPLLALQATDEPPSLQAHSRLLLHSLGPLDPSVAQFPRPSMEARPNQPCRLGLALGVL